MWQVFPKVSHLWFMLTNSHEPLFRVQCCSKIPNNIQFKKELVSAANQHQFCFTMYPIYSLRRAPGVVCCTLCLVFFLTLLQLWFFVFSTLEEAVAGCSHPALCTCSTVAPVGVPGLFLVGCQHLSTQWSYYRLPPTLFHVHRFYAERTSTIVT